MDRLHQSASTRFPSRIRIVTTVIPFPLILFWLTALHKRNYFWVVTKSLKLYTVFQKAVIAPTYLGRSNGLLTLADNIFLFSDRTITKCLLSSAIMITLQKKYVDSIRHSVLGLVAASREMFSPFFRYILGVHIIGVNVMYTPSKYKDMCTLILKFHQFRILSPLDTTWLINQCYLAGNVFRTEQ